MASKGEGGSGGGASYADEGIDDYPTYLNSETNVLEYVEDGSTLPFNPQEASRDEWDRYKAEIDEKYWELINNPEFPYSGDDEDFLHESIYAGYDVPELKQAYAELSDFYENYFLYNLNGGYRGHYEEALSGIREYMDTRTEYLEENYRETMSRRNRRRNSGRNRV